MKFSGLPKTWPKSQRIVIFQLVALMALQAPAGLADENYRQSETLFDDSQVATISITINPDSLAWILASENKSSDRYFRADLRFQAEDLDTSINEIGFRLRGNTSRDSQKKSFKISFDEFSDGRRFFGLRKMNLNGEHNDPSIMRSKLSWDLFGKMGIPASRAAHIKLFINGEYRGLYIHVEDYDKTFLKSRFDENDGNLYKCLWPADLAYRGNDPDEYKFSNDGRRAYELQTNEAADDYSDLARFITILTQTRNADLADSLFLHFDIWNFLKYLAVNVAVGSWDDYWYNQNNFYLYNNLKTGQFEFVPYDYDNTFGIGWDSNDWGVRDIYSWGSSDRPLTDRILANQQFKNLYTYIIRAFVTEFFNETAIFPRIDSLKTLISAAAADDYYRTLDYGYTVADFNNSYTTAPGAHVKYGIKPYIITRSASMLTQAATVDVRPFFISAPAVSFDTGGRSTIIVDIFDEKRPTELILHYKSGVQFVAVNLEIISERSDGPFVIYRYSRTLPSRPAGTELQFYFSATDDAGQIGKFPFAAPDNLLSLIFPDTLPKLFINEILASNSAVNADEYGEYDDWVEIYCDSGSVNLAGFYLTDNFNQPDKWAFPDTIVAAGAHLLIWADDQPEQGQWHTPFKLDKSGESLTIYRKIDTALVLIDSLTFGAQTSNISLGRIPDGAGCWAFMPPSPGLANSINAIWNNSALPNEFTVFQNYPNPFNGQTKIHYYLPHSAVVKIAVLDLTGRVVLDYTPQEQSTGEHLIALSLENIGSGIYFVRINAGNESRLLKCVLVK